MKNMNLFYSIVSPKIRLLISQFKKLHLIEVTYERKNPL